MIKILKKYWISATLVVTILILCFIKVGPVPELEEMTDFDKLVHLVMFMGISGVVFFDSSSYLREKISFRRLLLGSFLFPLFLGGAIEIFQDLLTTYRSGDWRDFLFDGIGVFIGIIICLIINTKLKQPTV
jgi:VanZ family protein